MRLNSSAASLAILFLSGADGSAFAQSAPDPAAADSVAIQRVAPPQGAATAAYLRMHHPLLLLDLCRQVKAGTRDAESVAPLIGGRAILDALVGRDLDALFEALTGPQDPAAGATGATLWSRILTNNGASRIPDADPIEPIRIQDVTPRGEASQVFHVTALADGAVTAQLPEETPFRILSMRMLSGVVTEQSAAPFRLDAFHLKQKVNDDGIGNRREPDTTVYPEVIRRQSPWTVPVQAGQDVEIEIGLPAGTPLPPDGVTSSAFVGDAIGGLWGQNVPLLAQPQLQPDPLFVYISAPKKWFDIINWAGPACGDEFQPLSIPLTLSNPFPPSLVKGTVQLVSAPQGLTKAPINFTLQSGGSVTLSLQPFVQECTPATAAETPLSFSITVSYQTVPLTAAGSQTLTFHYTVHEDSQTWPTLTGNAGGVDCAQNVLLYATGFVHREGTCSNMNFYSAKIQEDIFIGSWQPFPPHGDFYQLGFFDVQAHFFGITQAFAQTNYLSLRNQPLIITWLKF